MSDGRDARQISLRGALPAHNPQAFDFQVPDSYIIRNQGRAKSLGVGRNHDVKCSCTPSETPGTNPVRKSGRAAGRRSAAPLHRQRLPPTASVIAKDAVGLGDDMPAFRNVYY